MGRRQILDDIITKNCDNIQSISTTTKKSMTLPARMQPQTEFNETKTANLNSQEYLSRSPELINNNCTESIVLIENSKKGFKFNLWLIYSLYNYNIYIFNL